MIVPNYSSIHIPLLALFSCSCINLSISAAGTTTPPGSDQWYSTLYSRLQEKDYGFGGYGDACRGIVKVEDIVDHLSKARQIIEDQELSRKHHKIPLIEGHLRPKLKYFFETSKMICDFRKFLACDEVKRRCDCASLSAIHRNGTATTGGNCEIAIGKRCSFSEFKLRHLGVPVIPGEDVNITCIGGGLGRSECVPSFGGAQKICRCRTGFSGPQCKSSFVVMKNHAFLGRSLMKQGRRLKSTNGSSYFLFPWEIQEEVVKIMRDREMFEENDNPDEERMKQAESFYSSLEGDGNKENSLIRDIFIRRLSTLNYGEGCDPQRHKGINNPPQGIEAEGWNDINVWGDPWRAEKVKEWQLSILRGNKAICNWEKLLRCEEEKRVCQCQDGFVYRNGACHLPLGSTCLEDFDNLRPPTFSPLNYLKPFSVPKPPDCGSPTVCGNKPLIYSRHCWCPPPEGDEERDCEEEEEEGENENNNVNGSSSSKSAEGLLEKVESRFTLRLGDKCDPEVHEKLLLPSGEDKKSYKSRISTIHQILDITSPLQFCTLDEFLNCSSITRRCECFSDLVKEDRHCRVRNRDACLKSYASSGNEEFTLGIRMKKIEEMFRKDLDPGCIQLAKCDEKEKVCKCKEALKEGDLCQEERSNLTKVLDPSNVMKKDNEVTPTLRDINNVFFTLNHESLILEKIMTLKYGDKCDPSAFGGGDDMMERILKFFRTVGHSDEKKAKSKTFYEYWKASKWMGYLIQTGSKAFCNLLQGLSCHPVQQKCLCLPGSTYEDSHCKLKVNEVCDPNPGGRTPWIPSCLNNSQCLPSLFNFEHKCQCNEGYEEAGDGGGQCKLVENAAGNGTDDDISEEISGHCKAGLNGTKGCRDTSTLIAKDLKGKIAEILNPPRALSLYEPCDYQINKLLSIYFPTLPDFDPSNLDSHIPKGLDQSYKLLSKIHEDKTLRFCDKRKHLWCNKKKGRCTCPQKCEDRQFQDLCKGFNIKKKKNPKKRDYKAQKTMLEALCHIHKITEPLGTHHDLQSLREERRL